MDRYVKVPLGLNTSQIGQIDAYFRERDIGHIEATLTGLMIHIKPHVSDDSAVEHINLVCIKLKLCLICGKSIGWNGNAWRHAVSGSFPDMCQLQSADLPLPPPVMPDENDDRFGPVVFEVNEHNDGLDAAEGVLRMKLIGEALRHGFGPDWLEKRDA